LVAQFYSKKPLPSKGAVVGRLLSMTAICSSVVFASTVFEKPAYAQAQEQRYSITIATGPLADGLRYIQKETGAKIAFSPQQLRGASSHGVVGSLTAEEAIHRLLEGTDFVVKSDGGSLFVIAQIHFSAVETGTIYSRTAASATVDVPPIRTVATAPAEPEPVEELIVTGTRLTTGFETPTPVTVISVENLQDAAPNDIAIALKQLPSLAVSALGSSPSAGTVGGNNGQSLLNLRALGDNRSLVLLNGRRVISTNRNNSVDTNVLPQNLISRVDVVTGGASAAYGSDAVAGVINMVLDTKFVGWKGDFGGGISTYGDLPSHQASLAWGGSFANDRLHIVASTQEYEQYGTKMGQSTGRAWFDHPIGVIPNTTGKTPPANLALPNVVSSISSTGGLITNTILKGTQFLAGGTPAPFNYGTSAGPVFQAGGDGATLAFNFAATQWRFANFGHAEFELTDNTTVYAELAYSHNTVNDQANYIAQTGAQFNYTIFSGNPYLPASIQATMTANKIASFTMGRFLSEFPIAADTGNNEVFRQAFGIKGKNLFGAQDWSYDISFSHGRFEQFLAQNNTTMARQAYAAADAVINPQTGQIVCRSQFYNAAGVFVPGGTGMDPGCKPMNLFGANSVDPSTMAYTLGQYWQDLVQTQNVAQAGISGDLGDRFSFGAGPIAVAAGIEYRKEKAYQTSDPISQQHIDFTGVRGGPAAINGRLGPFRYGNPQPYQGQYDVKEGFAEIGIPLIKAAAWARSLNADLALRHTDYSTSGGVTTWKVGGDWQVVDDIRFRGSVSRDIRAPNLYELYNSATQGSQNLLYPSSSNGTTTGGIFTSSGNPNLTPERALTQTYGTVITPTFMPGFQASVDYYSIKINQAISTLSPQLTLDNCALGITQFCNNIQIIGGALFVATPYLNLNVLQNAGIDFEASYKMQLLDNPLQLTALATHITKSSTTAPGAAPLSTLGDVSSPHWRLNGQARYSVDDWSFFVQERYIGHALADATKVQGVFVDQNNVGAMFYTDLTITYNFQAFGSKSDIHLSINNLLNQDPPPVPLAPTNFIRPTNRAVYESLGRFFNLGMRFKF
jgi:outer membrane receptor protein involved in Fe transport